MASIRHHAFLVRLLLALTATFFTHKLHPFTVDEPREAIAAAQLLTNCVESAGTENGVLCSTPYLSNRVGAAFTMATASAATTLAERTLALTRASRALGPAGRAMRMWDSSSSVSSKTSYSLIHPVWQEWSRERSMVPYTEPQGIGASVEQDPNASRLSALADHAVAVRTAAAYEMETTGQLLALIPGVRQTVPDDLDEETFLATLTLVWAKFFDNAIIVLRPTPHSMSAMFYNPLLDMALLTRWEEDEDTLQISYLRAIAGVKIADGGAAVAPSPPWMTAIDPIAALQSDASDRLAAFGSDDGWLHNNTPGLTDETYRASAIDLMLVQPRLAWNASRWADATETAASSGDDPWLRRTLERIQTVLDTADTTAIQSLAPHTDAGTARLLAALDPRYRRTMVFDMALQEPDGYRTLIGSSSADGSFYVFAQCQVADSGCRLELFNAVAIDIPNGFTEVIPGVWSPVR